MSTTTNQKQHILSSVNKAKHNSPYPKVINATVINIYIVLNSLFDMKPVTDSDEMEIFSKKYKISELTFFTYKNE